MTDKPSGKSGPINMTADFDAGLYFCTYDEGARADIDHARGCVPVFEEIGGGKVMPMLVDFAGLKSQTKECRDFFTSDPSILKFFPAVAILVGSVVTRVIANFHMGISKPPIPTRMFDDRQKALAWLEQMKTDQQPVDDR